jgi:molecular chaperone DnaK
MIVGGYFQTIIEKNTTVPTSAGHTFTTVRDNQTSVRIMVFQGDSQRAEDNELLGEFILSGLRERPRGEVEVEVTFEISADGIVSVSAKDLETGQQQSITVTATSGLTEEEIQRMAREAQDYAVGVKLSEEEATLQAEVVRLLKDIGELRPRTEPYMQGNETGREAITKMEQTIHRAEEAVQASRAGKSALNELKEVKPTLERTKRMLKGIIDRLE